MRDISRLAWFSVSGPRVRASRQSVRAMASMRGSGWAGFGPAWVATSSSDRSRADGVLKGVGLAVQRN